MSTQPIWLNLGCGGNRLPAPWGNYDAELDINKPLPFRDESVDRIAIEHCLEHTDSAHGARFLKEAYRVLKPGGFIRICVPTLRNEMTPEHVFDLCIGHGHQQIYSAEILGQFLRGAGFTSMTPVAFDEEIDGHWKAIGKEKDALETIRMEATK